jgi:hypothetical protein
MFAVIGVCYKRWETSNVGRRRAVDSSVAEVVTSIEIPFEKVG